MHQARSDAHDAPRSIPTVTDDLADITAMLTVPSMITFFVRRDGAFALAGTDIEVLPCELGNVWQHFGLLLIIKPFFSFFIARKILAQRMARMLLGLHTLHGRSTIAPRLGLLRKKAAQARTPRRVSSPRRANAWQARIVRAGSIARTLTRRHASRASASAPPAGKDRLSQAVLADAFDGLQGFGDERKALIGRDFELSHLTYTALFYKTVKRSYKFFSCAVIFQLFAVLPLHAQQNTGADATSSNIQGGAIPFRVRRCQLESLSLGATCPSHAPRLLTPLSCGKRFTQAAWYYVGANTSASGDKDGCWHEGWRGADGVWGGLRLETERALFICGGVVGLALFASFVFGVWLAHYHPRSVSAVGKHSPS